MTSGLLSRVGEACLLGLGVAVFAALPTAIRTAGSGGSFPEGLLAGAAVLAPILVASLGLARAAGRGFRGITGTPVPRGAVLAIALWIGLAVPAMAGLGAVLKATTHHRGLGGATFAVFGAVLVAGLAVVAHRVVALGQAFAARGARPWIPAFAITVIASLPLLLAAAPLAGHGGGEGAGAVRAAVVDGAIAIVASLLVASLHLPASVERVARLAGVPAAVIVLLAGVQRVESSPALAKAMRAGGGLPATILGALEAWTDRDHDGAGAHFGGFDCDEGDPKRHPGAVEVPGDGVDQDCDGVDPARPRPTRAKAPAAVTSGTPTPPTPPAAKGGGPASALPDIVLVTLDSVRADHTSLYGYAKETTPRLVELAKRGTVFDHAYATAGDTQRTLAPLVSGRRFSDTAHDVREWPTILAEVDTLAERLKRVGYATIGVASFTWMSSERGFAQGFDRFETVYGKAHPERSVTGPFAVSAATDLWKQFEQVTAPVFLWVHLFDAHERWLEHPGISMGKGASGLYDGEVAFVDKQLGALLDALAASPRARRIAYVVHGTHGVSLDEHGSGRAAELYDVELRVPLVVAAPGVAPGRYDADAVSALDVPATVAEIGGASTEGFAGASLLPIVKGDLARKHGPVFARSSRRAAVVDWPLKLLAIERKRAERFLLFDLAADPAETKDVSEDRRDDLARLVELRGKLDRKDK